MRVIANDPLAKAAADFVAAVGNEVVKAQQERDIRTLVALSQKGDILDAIVNGLRTDFVQGYANELADERVDVDEYYYNLINTEAIRLAILLRQNHDSTTAPTITQYGDFNFSLSALTLPCQHQPSGCDQYVQRETAIVQLRDAITRQRARWMTLDSEISVLSNRLSPYSAVLGDIETANNNLVGAPRPGVAGMVAAIKPVISDLSSDTEALVNAARATPSPKPSHGS